MKSKFVIGDVHGCFDTLQALLKKLPPEANYSNIVFCGDLVDRGPKSRQVIDFVRNGKYDCVQGNHEDMMINWSGSFKDMLWLGNGGNKCHANYFTTQKYSAFGEVEDGQVYEIRGKFDRENFEKDKEWLKALPIILEYPEIKNKDGRYLVVSHSIVHTPGWKVRDTDPFYFKDLTLWGRSFHGEDIKEIYNVFGHTPRQWEPEIEEHYANIDTGCVFYDKPEYSKLTCLQFPEMTIYQQDYCEKN